VLYYASYLWRGIGQTQCSFEHNMLFYSVYGFNDIVNVGEVGIYFRLHHSRLVMKNGFTIVIHVHISNF